MKIVQAHNFYRFSGGEDTVVSNEKKLLESNGNEVFSFFKNNKDIDQFSARKKLLLLKNSAWSKSTFIKFDAFLKRTQPDVCHVHNFLPLLSPSVYDACIKNNVPIVQTLHNYRLICSNGLLLRNGLVCEDCLGKSPMGAVTKKCYRNSMLQTYAVANMLKQNNKNNTWSTKVDRYICLTEFAKQKFVTHGLPEEKLIVKPNFVEERNFEGEKENYYVFVGRLEKEKGVDLLIRIAPKLNITLKIIGEGSFASNLKQCKNVELIGKKSHKETLNYIQKAKALIFPSIWYEGMPMTILEAFSLKTPVIASNIGAMQSIITDKKNGFLFKINSETTLLEALKFIIENEKEAEKISNFAYQEFKNKYSKQSNYKILSSIYNLVINLNNEGIKNRAL